MDGLADALWAGLDYDGQTRPKRVTRTKRGSSSQSSRPLPLSLKLDLVSRYSKTVSQARLGVELFLDRRERRFA